jgi:hypothetical protein
MRDWVRDVASEYGGEVERRLCSWRESESSSWDELRLRFVDGVLVDDDVDREGDTLRASSCVDGAGLLAATNVACSSAAWVPGEGEDGKPAWRPDLRPTGEPDDCL